MAPAARPVSCAAMSHTMRAAFAASLALLAPAASAQLQAGEVAPSFTFDKVWNGGPTSFQELRGKLVILELSQTW
jgi:hypothetical protein